MITRLKGFLPEEQLGNEQLAALYPDWTAEKIFEKTGIRKRRVAAPGKCASDLAYAAADQLLGGQERDIDWLMFCTQTPDYLLPTTACVLQTRLQLPTTCAAFDFNLGCSGYIYGLSLADSLLRSGAARKVLLLTGDTYTKLIHPLDKSTRTIFGDAGTATLLTHESRSRLHSFVLGSDGRGAEQLMVKAGGARLAANADEPPSTEDSDDVRNSACLYMNGPEIFNFTITAVPGLVQAVLQKAGLSLPDIDLFVFHQANAYMLEHLRRKIGIAREKFVLHLEECGNTVSSSIPLALEAAAAQGRLQPGQKILLAGFGVGYSWGGCILEWN